MLLKGIDKGRQIGNICVHCGKGNAVFQGWMFRNQSEGGKVEQRYRCSNPRCRRPFSRMVSPRDFDIDHPEAVGRMLPTADYFARLGLDD